MIYALRKLIAFVFLGGMFWFIYQDLDNLGKPWFMHALGLIAIVFAFFWLLIPMVVVWLRIRSRRAKNRERHAQWLAEGGIESLRPRPVKKGDGALAVAFGDARETISQAFVHKADSYFHGGIDMECDHLAEHGLAAHDDDHDHEDCHDEHDRGEAMQGAFDPWHWINSHVRAPDVHRHLGGGETIELMPWFWASVKADPHNIEAWTTTWYIANNMMKDKDLALRVVTEGLEKNPDDPELLICRGRTIYDNGRGEFAAAREAFSAAVAAAGRMLQRGGSPDERILKARDFAQAYLDDLEKKASMEHGSGGR